MLDLKLLVRAAPSQEDTAILHGAKGLFCSVPAEHELSLHGSLLSALPFCL